MKRCWRLNPAGRPTFCDINKKLSDLIEETKGDNYICLLRMDLYPTECFPVEDECSDQLENIDEASSSVIFINEVLLENASDTEADPEYT